MITQSLLTVTAHWLLNRGIDKDLVIVYYNPHMKPLLIAGIVVVVLIAFLPAFYFYNKYQNAQKQLNTYPLIAQTDNKTIIDKVSKLIELPTGEEPTVATVSDLEKLQGQPFFAKAKKGDILLLYNGAKKAILYDPVGNKIVEVGPLILPTTASGVTPSLSEQLISPTPTTAAFNLKVVLYNGTTTAGLTKKVETELQEKLPDVSIVDKTDASKKDYPKTLVISLTGNKTDETEALAKAISAEVSSLPAGETKPPNADALIIVGADKK